MLDKNWRSAFRMTYGVHVGWPEEWRDSARVLFATSCSARKKPVPKAPAQELYQGQNVQVLRRHMAKHNNLSWGIISDLYGLVAPDKIIETYEQSPSDLSDMEKRVLGARVGQQAKPFTRLCMVMSSPCRVRPYLEILSASGLDVAYCTKFPELMLGRDGA